MATVKQTMKSDVHFKKYMKHLNEFSNKSVILKNGKAYLLNRRGEIDMKRTQAANKKLNKLLDKVLKS